MNASAICLPTARSAGSMHQPCGHCGRSGHKASTAASSSIMTALSTLSFLLAMLLTRLLNDCHRFPRFVYQAARLNTTTKTIEVEVRPRKGSKARCACCQRPTPGYDRLAARRFEFIPIWGYAVMLVYAVRRGQCPRCGVKVESVPWAQGKHTLCNAYMLYLAHWARKLSWKETAGSFCTSWEKIFNAVEFVVRWGLQHRSLDSLKAINVDEIQYGRGHQYLTLVYQLDESNQRLICVAKERTTESFQQILNLIGKKPSAQIEFACSDMGSPT